MSLFSDPRWGEALRICPTISATMSASASRRWRWGWRSACRLAIAARNRPVLRGALLGLASIVQTVPGLALLALFYPLLLALAAVSLSLVRLRLFRVRISAGGAGAGALFDAAGAAQHHHRPAGRRCRDPGGRARRRHDAAAIAVHGRIAAGAAGDHGGHPHRGGLGDRHRDAVDADRPDQPRQLHFCRAANPELGVRAVRLPRRRRAGARGRSIAGADRERLAQPQAASAPRSAASASPRWSRPRWCRRWRARHRAISSAPRPLPSNMCCRR